MIPLDDSNREQVFTVIADCLRSIGIEAAPISEWIVRRMDTYHDFQVGDRVTDYISALSKIRISRYKTQPVLGESVDFSCDSKRHYFYDKQIKLCNERDVTQEDIEQSQGILRYEVRHKAVDMYRERLIKTREFGELCTDEITGSLISKYFNMLPIANLSISTANEVQKILMDIHGTSAAIRLMGFIDAYGRGALDGIDPRTQIRYLKELRLAGVSPIIGTVDLPPLSLPFATYQAPAPTLIDPYSQENMEYRRRPRTRKSNDQRDIT